MGVIIRLLLTFLLLAVGSQARHNASPRAEEDVCCPLGSDAGKPSAPSPLGSLSTLKPVLGCCGAGWKLHCCIGQVCCLENTVVPRPGSVQGSSHRELARWTQWINVIVVILILALALIVLAVCCCKRDRGSRHQHLNDGEDLYTCRYGSVFGPAAMPAVPPPSAPPSWAPPMVSRWVDFSHKEPTLGTPLKPAQNTWHAFYQPPPRKPYG